MTCESEHKKSQHPIDAGLVLQNELQVEIGVDFSNSLGHDRVTANAIPAEESACVRSVSIPQNVATVPHALSLRYSPSLLLQDKVAMNVGSISGDGACSAEAIPRLG